MSAFVRDYLPKDFEDIKRIHEESGIDYSLPNLESPLFLVKKVVELDGKVICALMCRIEAETYLMLDKSDWGDPEQKLAAIRAVQVEVLHALWTQGIDNCVAFVPEEVNKHFAKRLIQLGWTRGRDGWIGWSRETKQ